MSKMGQELIEAMQELIDYSEEKIDLRTSKLNVYPVCDTISAEEIKETRKKTRNVTGSVCYCPWRIQENGRIMGNRKIR